MSVLDDVRMGLAEKGQSIADKARDSAEEVRQKNEIKKKESEMEQLIAKIGAMTVRNNAKRTTQECPDEMKRLLILNKELKELEAAVHKARPTKSCRFCGKAIPQEARYCTECGRRQDVDEQPSVRSSGAEAAPTPATLEVASAPVRSLDDAAASAPAGNSCPMCGAAIREGATECIICGYKIQR